MVNPETGTRMDPGPLNKRRLEIGKLLHAYEAAQRIARCNEQHAASGTNGRDAVVASGEVESATAKSESYIEQMLRLTSHISRRTERSLISEFERPVGSNNNFGKS